MIEKRHYRFKVLSPLHIGSGEVLLPATDFVPTPQAIFVLDQPSFLKEISRRGIASSHARELGNRGRNFDLPAFLRRHGLLTEDFLQSVSSYRLAGEGPIREIRAFIKSMNHPYVPGSSVKGAIRVGMLYRLLKNLGTDLLSEQLWTPVERALERLGRLHGSEKKRQRKKLRQTIGRFVDQLLCAFRLKEDRNNPRTDLLRCLRVLDSAPLDLSSLSVVAVEVRKLNGHRGLTTWVEALKPGTTFMLTIEVDWDLLGLFGKENPELKLPFGREKIPFSRYKKLFKEPLSPAVQLTQDLLEEESQRLPERWIKIEGGKPNFRLGWGQGLLSTTVLLLLPPELRTEVRNELFADRGNAQAPLTRKVSQERLMGFCQVGRVVSRKGKEAGGTSSGA